jgi:hypothetical protein
MVKILELQDEDTSSGEDLFAHYNRDTLQLVVTIVSAAPRKN